MIATLKKLKYSLDADRSLGLIIEPSAKCGSYYQIRTTRNNCYTKNCSLERYAVNISYHLSKSYYNTRNVCDFWSSQFVVKSFMTGRFQIDTSPLICRANLWTGFYMITVSVVKELIRQKGKSQNGGNKKSKHTKFS